MRTDLSEEQVARSGRVGCGAVSQARDNEGGVRGERRLIIPGREDSSSVAMVKICFVWLKVGFYLLSLRMKEVHKGTFN